MDQTNEEFKQLTDYSKDNNILIQKSKSQFIEPSRSPSFEHIHDRKHQHETGWRFDLAERLESRNAHIFILILVFLDFLCVMTELIITLTENNSEIPAKRY